MQALSESFSILSESLRNSFSFASDLGVKSAESVDLSGFSALHADTQEQGTQTVYGLTLITFEGISLIPIGMRRSSFCALFLPIVAISLTYTGLTYYYCNQANSKSIIPNTGYSKQPTLALPFAAQKHFSDNLLANLPILGLRGDNDNYKIMKLKGTVETKTDAQSHSQTTEETKNGEKIVYNIYNITYNIFNTYNIDNSTHTNNNVRNETNNVDSSVHNATYIHHEVNNVDNSTYSETNNIDSSTYNETNNVDSSIHYTTYVHHEVNDVDNSTHSETNNVNNSVHNETHNIQYNQKENRIDKSTESDTVNSFNIDKPIMQTQLNQIEDINGQPQKAVEKKTIEEFLDCRLFYAFENNSKLINKHGLTQNPFKPAENCKQYFHVKDFNYFYYKYGGKVWTVADIFDHYSFQDFTMKKRFHGVEIRHTLYQDAALDMLEYEEANNIPMHHDLRDL